MKPSALWAIIAILVGVSVFGIFKSFELATSNFIVRRSFDKVQSELETTKASLKRTKEALSENYYKIADLEGELNTAKTQLAKKDKETEEHLKNISFLSGKLREVVNTNEIFQAQALQVHDRIMRLEFENSEMNQRLSSLVELKKAIKEVKIRLRNKGKKNKPVPSVKKKQILIYPKETRPHVRPEVIRFRPEIKKIEKLSPSQEKKVVNKDLGCNEGFVVKEGVSTYQGMVDIKVLPAEEMAVLEK